MTAPPTNDTGGGTEPTTEEQPLTAQIIPNATQAYTGATIKFDASITGGTPPYTYSWYALDLGVVIDQDRSIILNFFEPGTFNYILTATDNMGQTASDSVQIHIRERLPGGVGPEPGGVAPPDEEPFRAEIIPNATQGFPSLYIRFDSKVIGGTPPYSYTWSFSGLAPDRPDMILDVGPIPENYYITGFHRPGTYTVILGVTDSTGRTASSNSVQITVEERPGGVLPPTETGQEGQPPGGGLLPGTVPGEEQPQVPPTVPDEGETGGGVTDEPEEGGEEDTIGEEEAPAEEAPPAVEEEEAATPANEGGG
jgi:PKD repeat protein